MTSDHTVPYEILIRFAPDGLVQGAHYVERRIVEIDGETVLDRIGPAEPLALVAGTGLSGLQSVLGDALAAALRTVDSLTAERDRLADSAIPESALPPEPIPAPSPEPAIPPSEA